MLLQSQNEELHLSLALPDAWQAGSVRGLVARGGFVVDMDWTDHRLQSAVVVARNEGSFFADRICYEDLAQARHS